MSTSLLAHKRFPGSEDAQEGFDAGIRHALDFLAELKSDYGYYSTIDFDEGYVCALRSAHELLEMDLETE